MKKILFVTLIVLVLAACSPRTSQKFEQLKTPPEIAKEGFLPEIGDVISRVDGAGIDTGYAAFGLYVEVDKYRANYVTSVFVKSEGYLKEDNWYFHPGVCYRINNRVPFQVVMGTDDYGNNVAKVIGCSK